MIFILLSFTVNVQASFEENCDTWDTNLWGHYWGPPTVENGTWVCDFPAGVDKTVQAARLTDSGYGTYKVRFRTSGLRVPEVNFYIFLYNGSIPYPNHQELDFVEVFGGNPTPNELSTSMYNSGTSKYWFYTAPFSFEDGNWHDYEFIFQSDYLECKLDGVSVWNYTQGQWPIPYPPMQFVIGGNSDGTNTEYFQFIIDNIEYIDDEYDISTPEISNVVLSYSDPLDADPTYGWANITCDVTDNVTVTDVALNITNPNGSWNNVSLNTGSGTSYYINSSTVFTQAGNYSYNIWVRNENDTSNISDSYTFSLAPNWDINKDGVCNIFDQLLVANSYEDTGTAGWIREDVDNNGEIQVFDLVLVSNHYGETWWEED